MSFDNVLDETRSLKINLVLKIEVPAPVGNVYFSKYQVQSGLTVDANKVGLVESFSVPATQIDLLSTRQDIGSATVEINDKNAVFATFMGQPLSALIGLNASLYVGFITAEGFPWSQYVAEKIDYVIKTIDMTGKKFKIGLRSPADRMQKTIFNFRGNLTTLITNSATTCVIETGTNTFKAASGANPQRAKIGNEFVQYTGRVFSAPNTTLTGLIRGDENSTAVEHKAGEECFFVEKVEANPIDILLQILISTGTGTNGVYDVLHDGVGIDPAKIDIAKFNTIKSTFFGSDVFTLFLYDIENALKYIETELLQANNLRFTEVDGLLSISVLDQSIPDDTLPQVTEDVILAKPSPRWRLTEQRLFNRLTIEYFFNEGTQTYAKTKTFDDLSSQAIHGIRTTSTLKFKGIRNDGIAQERGQRLLARFSTPQSEISCSQFLKTYKTPAGEKVFFQHPDLPNIGGGYGLAYELELLRKAINYVSGLVEATYVFTSYVNLRRGLIAPSDIVQTVIAANKITVGVGRGALYKVGYFMNLYDSVTCALIDGSNNVITDIVGDTITFANNFTGLSPLTTMIRFADYDNASDAQKSRYMFIVGGSGVFGDGTGGYKIF